MSDATSVEAVLRAGDTAAILDALRAACTVANPSGFLHFEQGHYKRLYEIIGNATEVRVKMDSGTAQELQSDREVECKSCM